MQLMEVDPRTLVPSPCNLRQDLGDLTELVASITSSGVLEAITVREVAQPASDEMFYEIVMGHRRHAAALKAKVATVPIVLKTMTDDERDMAMLIENLQRVDLTAGEEARGYFRLIERGHTIKDLAKAIGRPAAHVSARLALLELPDEVIKAVDEGAINLTDTPVLVKAFEAKLGEQAMGRVLADAIDGRNVEYRLEREVADAKREQLVATLRAKAEKAGVPFFVQTNYTDRPPIAVIGNGHRDDLDVPPDAHKKEPCSGIFVNLYGLHGTPKAQICCTDPKRHSAKGDSALKNAQPARIGKSDEQKAAEERARAAEAERLGRLLAVCEGIKPAELVVLLTSTLLANVRTDPAKTAVQVLGLEVLRTDHPYQEKTKAGEVKQVANYEHTLAKEAEKSARHARQVTAAVAIATLEASYGGLPGYRDKGHAQVADLADTLLGPVAKPKATKATKAEPEQQDASSAA